MLPRRKIDTYKKLNLPAWVSDKKDEIWKKLKNEKYKIKNTLKVPKKLAVLDYKNNFIKASIPSSTRFF